MRKPRGPRDEPTFDPIQEELDDARKRLGDPFEGMSPAERKVAERRWDRRQAKWQRRIDKAVAKWQRMTILEQKAWSDEYLRQDRKRRGAQSKPAPAAELPLLYAITAIAERDRAKAAKAREAEKAAEAAKAREAATATGEDPRTPRATRPSAAPEAPAAHTEPPTPEKPRRRRRGRPAVGPIGSQAGGVWYPPIYDEDDE